MQTLNVDQDRQARIIVKVFGFTQTRSYNAKLHDPNKKKKRDSLVLSRYSVFMVFHIFDFLFRTTPKKCNWMRAISVTVVVIILKFQFWMLHDFSYVQSSFSRSILTMAFWKTPYSWRFYASGSTYVLILSWVLNIMKPKWVKMRVMLSVGQKSQFALWKWLYQDVLLIIAFFVLSPVSLDFKFNLVLIEQFLPQFIYLFIFWYSVYLGVHPVPLRFFIKTRKILMRLNVFSTPKVWSRKMFLLCSYFLWNIRTC